jgi:hypothetical protein
LGRERVRAARARRPDGRAHSLRHRVLNAVQPAGTCACARCRWPGGGRALSSRDACAPPRARRVRAARRLRADLPDAHVRVAPAVHLPIGLALRDAVRLLLSARACRSVGSSWNARSASRPTPRRTRHLRPARRARGCVHAARCKIPDAGAFLGHDERPLAVPSIEVRSRRCERRGAAGPSRRLRRSHAVRRAADSARVRRDGLLGRAILRAGTRRSAGPEPLLRAGRGHALRSLRVCRGPAIVSRGLRGGTALRRRWRVRDRDVRLRRELRRAKPAVHRRGHVRAPPVCCQPRVRRILHPRTLPRARGALLLSSGHAAAVDASPHAGRDSPARCGDGSFPRERSFTLGEPEGSTLASVSAAA